MKTITNRSISATSTTPNISQSLVMAYLTWIMYFLKTATKLTAHEFETFLSNISHLEHIRLGGSENCNLYLGYLHDMDNTQQLQHIKEISNDGVHHGFTSNYVHFQACYNFHATLIHLSVRLENDGRSGGILQSLPEFKQLVNLQILNLSDRQSTTFDIQQLCPKLTSLDFTTSFGIPDDRVDEELLTPISTTDSNLQHLVVELPQLSYSYM